MVPNSVLLCSLVFKFIAMIIGVLGNVTVITHTIFWNKEKTATSYLIGNLALADLLVCLTFYPIWIIEFIQTVLNIDSDQDLFCKLSRSTMRAFMFASATTLVAITVDRYLYFAKPLKYSLIMTCRRVYLVVSGIWMSACCLFIVLYVNVRSYYNGFIICTPPDSIRYFTQSFVGFMPLILVIFLNFLIFSVARKQRKRILSETTIFAVNNPSQQPSKRMSFVLQFFVAFKAARTFAIVIAVFAFCIIIPTVVHQVLRKFWKNSIGFQLWYVIFNFEFYGINSIVNAFIYGMRHVKYRKAYLRILFELLSCRRSVN